MPSYSCRSVIYQHACLHVEYLECLTVPILAGESRELVAMEEDFLKTLAETRELEQAFSAAVAKTDGDADSGPGTRLGFQSLMSRTDALKSSVADILKSLATEKQRFGELHSGWRVMSCSILNFLQIITLSWRTTVLICEEKLYCDCACVAQEDRGRAEALLYFNGKHSNETSTNGSSDAGGVLDPVLQELTASFDIQLQALQKQSSQLNDCVKVNCAEVFCTNMIMGIPIVSEVPFNITSIFSSNKQLLNTIVLCQAMEDRASKRQFGKPLKASTQQLYDAVNAQTAVAIAQVNNYLPIHSHAFILMQPMI